jgi:hypothetical protein
MPPPQPAVVQAVESLHEEDDDEDIEIPDDFEGDPGIIRGIVIIH